MKFVIISGGHIDDMFALNWLEKNKYDVLMAADSGMNFLHRNNIMPDIIAGDFDSVDEVSLNAFTEFAEIALTTDRKVADDNNFKVFSEHSKEDAIIIEKTVDDIHLKEVQKNIELTSEEKIKNSVNIMEFDKTHGVEIIKLNPIKDDTDTEFVIREAIRRGATEIVILGATGTRLDHVLANIYLLGIGLEYKVQMELVDAYNRIRMINTELTIDKDTQFGNFVSVLPVKGDAKGVTLEGVKYPLKDAVIPCFSSLGVSNEITEEQAKISVEQGCVLVIESRDKK